LRLLAAAKERFDLKVYAYCLVANKALLLIRTERPNLSAAMQDFANAYSKSRSAARGAVGRIFQGRYKALLVEEDRFLGEMTRYVHLEPARMGLGGQPWRYPWSSCSDYTRLERKGSLVDADEIVSRFARNRLTACVRYVKWLRERLGSGGNVILPVVHGAAVGSEEFLVRAEARNSSSDVPALSHAQSILVEVASQRGMAPEVLSSRQRKRDISAARREAIYRMWKESRLGMALIGRIFNVTPGAVSQAIRAFKSVNYK
jgi:hypothetical protein